jgi:hypothetical protein
VKAAMNEMQEGITGEKTPANPAANSNNSFTPDISKTSAYK